MIIPTEARRQLYDTQARCARDGICYFEFMWQQRYPNPVKSTGDWPYKPVAQQVSTVVPMRKRKP